MTLDRIDSSAPKRGSTRVRTRRLTAKLSMILSALAFVVVGIFAPAAAHADADGCTSASGPGYVCIVLDGTGQYVDHVGGVRGKPGQWLCGYEIKAWGTLKSGYRWSQTKLSECGWSRVFADFYPRKYFRNNSQFCVATREQGQAWEPYYACVWIRA